MLDKCTPLLSAMQSHELTVRVMESIQEGIAFLRMIHILLSETEKAGRIGSKAGLKYVYMGNAPGKTNTRGTDSG